MNKRIKQTKQTNEVEKSKQQIMMNESEIKRDEKMNAQNEMNLCCGILMWSMKLHIFSLPDFKNSHQTCKNCCRSRLRLRQVCLSNLPDSNGNTQLNTLTYNQIQIQNIYSQFYTFTILEKVYWKVSNLLIEYQCQILRQANCIRMCLCLHLPLWSGSALYTSRVIPCVISFSLFGSSCDFTIDRFVFDLHMIIK